MTNDSPFFLTKVECPICRTINEFETVRLGAYVEEGRDTDFCPIGVTWRHPKYQAYNPLAFFIATCSNCFYSRELTTEFRDWKNDQTFRTYRLKTAKARHLEELARDDSFVRELGEAIELARYPNESAILKLLLAIFDEEIADHHSQLDVGRFYLRIGWVFRGMETQSDPQHSLVQALMSDMESKFSRIENAWQKLHGHVTAFAEHLEGHFTTGDVTASLKARLCPYREKFETAAAALGEKVEGTRQSLRSIGDLMREYRTMAAGSDVSATGRTFHRFSSFTDFLLHLRSRWSGVVTGQREALAMAVQCYKRAFARGRDIAPGNQQIQASYLIAELSRRIGEYDQAREYFNSTIRHGQEFIYRNRSDRTQTALARKILELAIEQGKINMASLQPV